MSLQLVGVSTELGLWVSGLGCKFKELEWNGKWKRAPGKHYPKTYRVRFCLVQPPQKRHSLEFKV